MQVFGLPGCCRRLHGRSRDHYLRGWMVGVLAGEGARGAGRRGPCRPAFERTGGSAPAPNEIGWHRCRAPLGTLLAWLRGEPRVCSMAPIPDEADEDARRCVRERTECRDGFVTPPRACGVLSSPVAKRMKKISYRGYRS